jgi:tyrosyl-tRNA synthetase
VDPTSDSLHLGNFVVFMIAMHFCLQGNKLIIIVGGATGMIGDPGGKNSERPFLSEEEIVNNTTSILKQVQRICDHLSTII